MEKAGKGWITIKAAVFTAALSFKALFPHSAKNVNVFQINKIFLHGTAFAKKAVSNFITL